MSFVTTQPEALFSAAGNLQGIGEDASVHDAAAASPTTAMIPTAANEVSKLTAAQFTLYAQLYPAVSTQAATNHEAVVSTLNFGGESYAAAGAANAVAAG